MNALETIRDLVAKGEQASENWRLDAVGAARFISADGPVPTDAPPDAKCPRMIEAWNVDDLLFALAAANARPALKLLVELVEAARRVSTSCRKSCDLGRVEGDAEAETAVEDWRKAQQHLDALLAKLEERDDA